MAASDYRPSQGKTTSSRSLIWAIPLVIVTLRTVNSLTVKTFFQPDEYFQSLEPAWQLAFGAEGRAWITWVCRTRHDPSLCTGLNPVGMERATTIGSASSGVCRSLSCSSAACESVSSKPSRSSKPLDRSAEALAGEFCFGHGLSHLEARSFGLWRS